MPRQRLLLIRPGAMGDVCLALPLARVLARHFEVSWLVRRHYAPLLSLFPGVPVTPVVTDLDPASASSLRGRFDVVLDLSHWPEVSRLVAGLGDVPLRVITHDPDQDERLGVNRSGIDLYAPYNLRVPVSPSSHQMDRWLTLVRAVRGRDEEPLPPAPSPKRRGGERVSEEGNGCAPSFGFPPPLRFGEGAGGRGRLSPDWPLPPVPQPGKRLRVFVHPHAGKKSKIWPVSNFVEALTTLARGRPVECWVNSGNRQEWLRALGLSVMLRTRGVRTRLVPLDRSYRRLARALGSCDLALGNDSGPMHLASLLGVPGVVLFGPYAAWEFSPLWRSRCVSPPLEGQPSSAIPVASVVSAVEEQLAALAPRRAA